MNSKLKKEFEEYHLSLNHKYASIEDAIEMALTGRTMTMPAVPPPEKNNMPLDDREHATHTHSITSPFGERVHPTTNKKHFHSGIDIGGSVGDKILSYDSGVVTVVSSDPRSGNYVIIEHKDGFTSSYSHLSKIMVKKGQSVSEGDVIGLMGDSGYATGPHLHFRLKYKGNDVNPELFIATRRLVG